MFKYLSPGRWLANINKKTDTAVTAQVFSDERLNEIADLGTWNNESRNEAIANSVIMSYSKEMLRLLDHVDRYGCPDWLKHDVATMLAEMDILHEKLRRKYADPQFKRTNTRVRKR